MGIIEDKFREWLGEQWPDGNTRWHQDDLEDAWAAGWITALQQRGDDPGGLPARQAAARPGGPASGPQDGGSGA